MAFYAGDQWLRWDRSRGGFNITPQEPGIPRVTVNHVLPVVQNAIGKIVKVDPTLQVMPLTGDDRSVDAADASQKLLQHLFRKLHMDRKINDLLLWAAICGSALFKVTWNDSEGAPIFTSDDGSPIRAGEIDTAVCSPFEVSVDPIARHVDDARYMIHSRQRTVEWIKEVFGVEVTPDADPGTADLYNLRILNLNSAGYAPFSPMQHEDDPVAMVHEYWERPSNQHPDGRLMIVTSNQVLYDDVNPYQHGQLPFVKMDYFPMPARFWGMGIVEPIIGIQKSYNIKATRELESMEYSNNQFWIVPSGSVAEDAMVVQPGSFIEYNPQLGKPESITPVPINPLLITSKQQDLSDLAEITAMHELVPGAMPSGARSLALVMLIEQQDETRMRPTINQFNMALEAWGWHTLKLCHQYYTDNDTRTIRSVGPDNTWESHQFKAADIPEEFEVSVEASSSLPANKQQRFEYVLQAVNSGMLDPDKGAMLLGLSDVTMGQDIQEDHLQASHENEDMLAGREREVHDYDNHQLHIKAHNSVRKRDSFDGSSPVVKNLFAQHVSAHQQMLAQEQGVQEPAEPQTEGGQGMARAAAQGRQQYPMGGVTKAAHLGNGQLQSQIEGSPSG